MLDELPSYFQMAQAHSVGATDLANVTLGALERLFGLSRSLSPAGYRSLLIWHHVFQHLVMGTGGRAIAEAETRPTMRFVPVKNAVQSDIQALHRTRARLVAERTALINHLRALLLGG